MANNLKSIRKRLGLSQEKAAAAMGTTRNQLVKLESGMRRLSDVWISRAAKAYGVDPGEIVTNEQKPGELIDRFNVSIERASAVELLSDLLEAIYGSDPEAADEHAELALALLEEFAAGESATRDPKDAGRRDPMRAVARFLARRRRTRTNAGNPDA